MGLNNKEKLYYIELPESEFCTVFRPINVIHLFRLPTQVISVRAFLSEGTAGLHVQFLQFGPQQQNPEWVVALVWVSAQPERWALGGGRTGPECTVGETRREEGGVRVASPVHGARCGV